MSLLQTGRPSKTEKAIAAVQNLEEECIRMNVDVPKDFYKKVKLYALNQDITVRELVIKSLNECMNK